jgi:hypothetical protein
MVLHHIEANFWQRTAPITFQPQFPNPIYRWVSFNRRKESTNPQPIHFVHAEREIPQTGELLALLGSADFNNEKISGQIDMAISPRQPGSAVHSGSPCGQPLHRR